MDLPNSFRILHESPRLVLESDTLYLTHVGYCSYCTVEHHTCHSRVKSKVGHTLSSVMTEVCPDMHYISSSKYLNRLELCYSGGLKPSCAGNLNQADANNVTEKVVQVRHSYQLNIQWGWGEGQI